jgi:hypothetical protein
MSENLLTWSNPNVSELLVFLYEHMKGTWQGNISVKEPTELYIPMGKSECRVKLKFDGPKLKTIEPGPAFNRSEWDQIRNEIERSTAGPMKVGREFSFSARRVTGSWRGARSGVQICPPPTDVGRLPEMSGYYPFVLEFPLMDAGVDTVTNHRRICKSRDLTLLLNLFFPGGVRYTLPSSSLPSFITDSLSPPAATQLEVVEAEEYEKMLGDDGTGLRIPSDLDDAICLYEALSGSNREKFDRALYWFSTLSPMRGVSISASYVALVFAIESMNSRSDPHDIICPVCGRPSQHEYPGSTKMFKNFLAAYAPGASAARDRDLMYELRSDVVHGEHLVEFDREIPIMGWTPSGHKERERYGDLWKLTRTALRNWLKNRSRYLQQAREVCAYYHWMRRGHPLWEADVDWAFAEQEFPA